MPTSAAPTNGPRRTKQKHDGKQCAGRSSASSSVAPVGNVASASPAVSKQFRDQPKAINASESFCVELVQLLRDVQTSGGLRSIAEPQAQALVQKMEKFLERGNMSSA